MSIEGGVTRLEEALGQEQPDTLRETKKISSLKEIQGAVADLFHEKTNPDLRAARIKQLVAWAKEDAGARVDQIDDTIAVYLEADPYHQLTLPIFLSLGQLHRLPRDRVGVSEKFIEAMNNPHHYRAPLINPEVINDLIALIDQDTPEARQTVASSLAFLRDYLVIHRGQPQIIETDLTRMAADLYLEGEQHTTNFLLTLDLQATATAIHMWPGGERGEMAGVPTGGSDEMLYKFRHTDEALANRLALGITNGHVLAEPVLEIAPGYLGRYQNSLLMTVYRRPERKNYQAVETMSKDMIKQNNPAAGWVYDEITEATLSAEHQSQKLNALWHVWELKKQLGESGETFVYDLDRFTGVNLHPFVRGELLSFNEETVRKQPGALPSPSRPLTIDELSQLLSPTRPLTVTNWETYQQLSQLHVRKKILDRFGLDLASLDFWVQRNFLAYLEGRTLTEVSRLESFVKKFGQDGLAAFIALETNPAAGEAILCLESTVGPERAKQLLASFRKIGAQAAHIEDFLRREFNVTTETDHRVVGEIGRALLTRAEALLLHPTPHQSGDDLEENLQTVATDQLALATAFRVFKKDYPNFRLADVQRITQETLAGPAITADDQQEMAQILTKNWQELPDVAPTVVANFKQALTNPQSQFHFLKYKDKLLGFMRFDKLPNDDLEWGSFNIRPALRRSGLGESLMVILNEKAKTNRIHANAHPRQEIASRYIGADFGFVADTMIRVPKTTGKPQGFPGVLTPGVEESTIAFSLIRDDRVNPAYHLFHASSKDLADLWHTNKFGPADTQIVLKFDKQTAYQEMTETMEQILATGRYVLTAYRPYPPKSSTMYLGFELRRAASS
jgi:hypothetical protein